MRLSLKELKEGLQMACEKQRNCFSKDLEPCFKQLCPSGGAFLYIIYIRHRASGTQGVCCFLPPLSLEFKPLCLLASKPLRLWSLSLLLGMPNPLSSPPPGPSWALSGPPGPSRARLGSLEKHSKFRHPQNQQKHKKEPKGF